jgi:hypothetical protein
MFTRMLTSAQRAYQPVHESELQSPSSSSLGPGGSCLQLENRVRRAAELSQWKDPDAVRAWRELKKEVADDERKALALASSKLDNGTSVIEATLLARDWQSCQILWVLVPQGGYANGRIVRDERWLRTTFFPEANLGIHKDDHDNWYWGEVLELKPHGYGRRTYASKDFFEGEWFRGKKHGMGVTNAQEEQFFIDGIPFPDVKKGVRGSHSFTIPKLSDEIQGKK